MPYDYKHSVPEFNPGRGGTDLTFLTVTAAREISNHALSGGQEDESVRHLAQLLDETTKGDDPSALFVGNFEVFGYAIPGRKNAIKYWEGKRTDNIPLQINLIAKDLRDFKSLPKERQEALAGFCANLSNEIMIYHSRNYSGRRRLVA